MARLWDVSQVRTKRERRDRVARMVEIRMVTPLFGGGVEARRVDPVRPISEKGIRGQLRFWWRATRGARCSSVEQLAEREARVFGSQDLASAVDVRVRVTRKGEELVVEQWEWKEDRTNRGHSRWGVKLVPSLQQVGYALFSFQADESSRKDAIREAEEKTGTTGQALRDQLTDRLFARCTENIEFVLDVTYPDDIVDDVNAALWAWINFGGFGSRTRRGCGALWCKEFAPASHSVGDIATWWRDSLKKWNIRTGQSRDWPTLPSEFFVGAPYGDAMKAWAAAITPLRRFRQGAAVGRNGDRGRSYWPEAESIRELTQRANRHPKDPMIPSAALDHFPRAALGLPIGFKFITPGDPPPTEVRAIHGTSRSGRMASPVILRPLAIGNAASGPIKFAPLAVALCTGGPVEVGLCRTKVEPPPTPKLPANRGVSRIVDPALATLTPFEVAKNEYEARHGTAGGASTPTSPRGGDGDAVHAFMDLLEGAEHGFHRVT